MTMKAGALLGLLLVKLPEANAQANGKTTRYWDCCKPSCSWNGKAAFSRPVLTCAKDGFTKQSDANLGTSCGGGPAYVCNDNMPWQVSNTVSYGFAAAHLTGQTEADWCCACYELTFTSGSASGKKFLVQVTNTGGDLGENHFDLQIPGGGVGIFNACSNQWNAPADGWGDRYGGVRSRGDCYGLPQELQSGCLWRFDWFNNADNPTMTFKRYQCPASITSKTGCVRDDDKNQPVYDGSVPPGPGPDPGCPSVAGYTVQSGVDHYGDDIENAKTNDVAVLANRCNQLSNCAGFTKSGWVKTKTSVTNNLAGNCLYTKTSSPAIVWSTTADGIWAFGCDFNGADLKSVKSTGQQCSGQCKATSGCTHYTWTNFNGGTCWMKKGAAFKQDAVATGNNGMVCGILPLITWNGKSANGCDFNGGDFKNVATASSACGTTCTSTSGCTHYTWSNHNAGTCWMKKGTQTQANAFSTYDKTMVCGLK